MTTTAVKGRINNAPSTEEFHKPGPQGSAARTYHRVEMHMPRESNAAVGVPLVGSLFYDRLSF